MSYRWCVGEIALTECDMRNGGESSVWAAGCGEISDSGLLYGVDQPVRSGCISISYTS